MTDKRMASLRTIVMATAALVFASALAQVRPMAQNKPAQNRAGACPLTDAQTRKSIEAFAEIHRFLTREERCFNCHGGVNPFINGPGLDRGDEGAPASKKAHGGGLIIRQRDTAADGTVLIEGECMDCHNNMVRKGNGSTSRWMLAPNFLSFVDKDATTLCRQIKRSTGDAEHFLGHLRDDNGGNTFALTAFKGDRGLDPDVYGDLIPPEPPGISHAALMQLGQNWVAAMGGSFKGDESCGCEYRHAKWSGQIHYTFEVKAEGHSEQVDFSNRRFSQITLTFTDGVGTASSHAEVMYKSETRRGIVNNGSASLIKEFSDDNQGSGSDSVPATVDVEFRANGEYSVKPAFTPKSLGIVHSLRCRYARDGGAQCDTQDLPLYAETWTVGDVSGTSSDPNHVQDSKTGWKGGSGTGQNDVIIRTLTWDLWRSN